MMKVINVYVFVLVCLTGVKAWANEFKPYEWEKDRKRYVLAEKDAALSEVILKQHAQYDYVLKENEFLMYSTVHRIVYVNNSEAVQKHNRIVISMNSTLELLDVKARAINKDGKAVYFDKTNLKELKDENSGNAYKIFAIEGIELGSEIEYYFTRKMTANLFDRAFMQFDAPIKENSFLLTSPGHLRFDFKSYNNFPEVKKAENDVLNTYTAEMKDVPALKKEPFSYFTPNRKRIEFKLAYNVGRSQERLYTWDEAAKTFYKMLVTLSKEDDKAIDKFIKTLGDNPAHKLEDRIKNVETKIKTTIQVNKEGDSESLNQVESILKVKLASHQGMTRLFVAVFDKLKINCQPVITCSRENVKFDGSFDSWSFLDDYVLFFPDTRGFLEPYSFEFRYPLIQPDFTATQGLFMEPVVNGAEKSASSSIGEIPATDYAVNQDNLDIDVIFTEDLAANKIRQKRDFGGYNAALFTPYYDLIPANERVKMIEELTKQTAPDAAISTWKASPLPGANAGNFLVDVDFVSNHFVEKAGPRILFKVGELIGPQIEMYRDDERTTVVENEYNRKYDRKIRVHIPKGYQVKNLNDLKIDIAYRNRDYVPYMFKSDYTVKDDVVEVTIVEYYKEIYAPLTRYEDFRKVVNAAADFNKITLVLEKKS
ncbi:DUF3857 domain-containing protein [Chryseolinea lacunae]|uniref:DUF3857 domain-containing protein n=1 Tax=Chryseolinea lacunae TaxID=2801331 RepID=A0ABS1KT36_9BACT|nr:DUF3857 domain-containing protein [Chryseolinea lacunae]MBL0742519.1 DUF3857 domain-containing protein [Chryseolinea lacunae]